MKLQECKEAAAIQNEMRLSQTWIGLFEEHCMLVGTEAAYGKQFVDLTENLKDSRKRLQMGFQEEDGETRQGEVQESEQ